MYCIDTEQLVEQIIKKSRFIGIITPCDTENKVSQILFRLQTEYAHASHIAFAFRILTPSGTIMRFHDAGEPSGTAGKPIYQHLDGQDLINTLIVVIRYFGGIKLGAGGLTRAYGNTAKHVVNASLIQPYTAYCSIILQLEYPKFQLLDYQLKKWQGFVEDKVFSDHVDLTLKLPVDALDEFVAEYPQAKIIKP